MCCMGFGASRYKIGGLDSKPPVLHKPCPSRGVWRMLVRRTQEGCGGLRGGSPGAFPKAGLIFQQPFSLPENAQTLAGIALRAAGKSVKNFQQRRNLPENFSSKEFRTATAFSSFLIIWVCLPHRYCTCDVSEEKSAVLAISNYIPHLVGKLRVPLPILDDG